MPAGPVMRPGAEAWHGGSSTWALGCVGGWGLRVGAGIDAHRPVAAHLTWRAEEGPDQLRRGFYGFWPRSTPRLASSAAQGGQGGPERERDTDRQPPACPETSQEFAFAAAKQLPLGSIHPSIRVV